VHSSQQLSFVTTESGLRWADIKTGSGDTVAPSSRVTFHAVGRLVGKQGWVFMNTQAEEDEPYRLTMGSGQLIDGMEEGLLGMRQGGTRRLVIPSRLGYKDRAHEPVPRSFGQRQRLYGTVLNENRRRQESEGLGAGNDVAGVVAIDVQLINVRPAVSSARVSRGPLMPAAAMAAAVDDHWPPLSSSGVPLEAVVASKAQSTQRAAALVLPLLAYKAAATLQGVRLQWYLDASIALATAALLVFGSRAL